MQSPPRVHLRISPTKTRQFTLPTRSPTTEKEHLTQHTNLASLQYRPRRIACKLLATSDGCLTLANKTIPISYYTFKTRTDHLPYPNPPTKLQTVQVLQTRTIKEISSPAKRHLENYPPVDLPTKNYQTT